MKQIIINSEELQVSVAVVEDGKLQDYFMERNNKDRIVGSIYKGRIKNLEPSLQAAFVDIGVGKNAFLHYWDMLPATQEMLEDGDEDDADDDSAPAEPDTPPEGKPAPEAPAAQAAPEAQKAAPPPPAPAEPAPQPEKPLFPARPQGLIPLTPRKPAPAAPEAPAAPATPEAQAAQPAQEAPAAQPAAEAPASPVEPVPEVPPQVVSSELPENPPPQQQQAPKDGQGQGQSQGQGQGGQEGGGHRRRRRGGWRHRRDAQEGAGAGAGAGVAPSQAPKPGFFRRLCEKLLPGLFRPKAVPVVPQQPQNAGGKNRPNAPAKGQLVPLTPTGKEGREKEKGGEERKGQLVPLTPTGKDGQSSQGGKRNERKQERRPEKKGPTVEDIPNLFKPDQEILVQVTKGPIGTKGARVTTNLSIPGRYLVLLPNCTHVGVSRRVEDHEERNRLKQMVKTLTLPPNMGVICRTVGAGLKREHFQRDLDMLLDAWKKGEETAARRRAPVCIYQEPALEERVLRDCLTQDIDEIICDTKDAYDRALAMLRRFDRQDSVKLKLYSNPTPVFIKYGLGQQIENIFNRKVMLPSGGYLCIDETEALIAIDVNTGKNRSGKDQPETILETNLEAVKEIARQLRLRNIGGLVVLDLIDMRSRKDQMAVFRAFKQYTSEDHARIKLYPISGLGLLEMSRQRESESLESTMYEDCPHCKGRGLIKTSTSVSVEIQRRLNELLARKKDVEHFVIAVHPKVLERLKTADRKVMDAMAAEYSRQLSFVANAAQHEEEYHITDRATGKEF